MAGTHEPLASPELWQRVQDVLDHRFKHRHRKAQHDSFDDEVMDWATEALRQSHAAEKEHHDEAIARLQEEYDRQQHRLLRALEAHQSANQACFQDGVQLLSLARRAGELFRQQDAVSKRRLLVPLLSNRTWEDGKLQLTFRRLFDALSLAATSCRER